MLNVSILLTNRCNFKCLYCLRGRSQSREDLSLDLFDKILKEAKYFGDLNLNLTGGEPLLHPDLDKIICTIIKYTGRIKACYLNTNGWYFKKAYPLLVSLKKVLPLCIMFSLDGTSREIHDKIRKNGSYDRIMEAIDLCRKAGIATGIKIVSSKYNKQEIEKIALFASGIKANILSILPVLATPESVKNGLVLSFEEILALRDEINRQDRIFYRLRRPDNQLLETMYRRGFPCVLRADTVNINYRGDLTFCCNLSDYAGSEKNTSDVIGSLKEESFLSLYKRFLWLFIKFNNDKFNYLANEDESRKKINIRSACSCLYCWRYFRKIDQLKISSEYGVFI